MTTPKRVDPKKFEGLLPRNNPALHEELEWYEIDRALGVVIRDVIDKDYSWALLERSRLFGNYGAVDVQASIPTLEEAREDLFESMTSLAELHARD